MVIFKLLYQNLTGAGTYWKVIITIANFIEKKISTETIFKMYGHSKTKKKH
jgi:hypothetical protein